MKLHWRDLGTPTADAHLGSTVTLTGFMATAVPMPQARHFVLLPEPACCAGCLPSDKLAAIAVNAKVPLRLQGRAVTLRGILTRAGPDSSWHYALEQACRDEPLSVTHPTRRHLLGAAPLLCLAACTPAADPAQMRAVRQSMDAAATVDMHSHAGALIGRSRVGTDAAFRPVSAPMREGGLAVICLAVVSDSPTHRTMADGRIHPYRDPIPGELYTYTQRGLQRAHALAQAEGLAIITDAAALRRTRADAPGAVIATEGGDFLEGRADRIDEAYERWQLRHLQLVHYRPNELGDIQTEAPVHDGLTDAGAEAIRRCNSRGLVVDMAHATYATVQRACAVTTRPLLLSHTSLNPNPGSRSRTISPDHARAIAGTGGVIGIWPPTSRFPTLAAMAVGMARTVDVVGIDHVGLGTDMEGLVGPSVLDTYTDLPLLAAALRDTGFSTDERAKLLGGNYARVFAASLG